jgi:hypothetical protein
MPRQVRLQDPGALDPVMARGDRREEIYRDDEDRRMFLEALGEVLPGSRKLLKRRREILEASV